VRGDWLLGCEHLRPGQSVLHLIAARDGHAATLSDLYLLPHGGAGAAGAARSSAAARRATDGPLPPTRAAASGLRANTFSRLTAMQSLVACAVAPRSDDAADAVAAAVSSDDAGPLAGLLAAAGGGAASSLAAGPVASRASAAALGAHLALSTLERAASDPRVAACVLALVEGGAEKVSASPLSQMRHGGTREPEDGSGAVAAVLDLHPSAMGDEAATGRAIRQHARGLQQRYLPLQSCLAAVSVRDGGAGAVSAHASAAAVLFAFRSGGPCAAGGPLLCQYACDVADTLALRALAAHCITSDSAGAGRHGLVSAGLLALMQAREEALALGGACGGRAAEGASISVAAAGPLAATTRMWSLLAAAAVVSVLPMLPLSTLSALQAINASGALAAGPGATTAPTLPAPPLLAVLAADASSNALVLHPDSLLPPTKIAGVFTCMRRAVLGELYGDNGNGGGGSASPAALMGNLKHELFQAALHVATGSSTGRALLLAWRAGEAAAQAEEEEEEEEGEGGAWSVADIAAAAAAGDGSGPSGVKRRVPSGPAPAAAPTAALPVSGPVPPSAAELSAFLRSHARSLVHSPSRLTDLLGCDMQDGAALRELRDAIPYVLDWLRCYVGLPGDPDHPLTGAARPFRVLRVLGTEDAVWSPVWGLKGIVDATVEVRLTPPAALAAQAAAGPRTGIAGWAGAGAGGPSTTAAASDPAAWPVVRLPWELKTGKRPALGSSSPEHRAQLALYALLLRERQSSACLESGGQSAFAAAGGTSPGVASGTPLPQLVRDHPFLPFRSPWTDMGEWAACNATYALRAQALPLVAAAVVPRQLPPPAAASPAHGGRCSSAARGAGQLPSPARPHPTSITIATPPHPSRLMPPGASRPDGGSDAAGMGWLLPSQGGAALAGGSFTRMVLDRDPAAEEGVGGLLVYLAAPPSSSSATGGGKGANGPPVTAAQELAAQLAGAHSSAGAVPGAGSARSRYPAGPSATPSSSSFSSSSKGPEFASGPAGSWTPAHFTAAVPAKWVEQRPLLAARNELAGAIAVARRAQMSVPASLAQQGVPAGDTGRASSAATSSSAAGPTAAAAVCPSPALRADAFPNPLLPPLQQSARLCLSCYMVTTCTAVYATRELPLAEAWAQRGAGRAPPLHGDGETPLPCVDDLTTAGGLQSTYRAAVGHLRADSALAAYAARWVVAADWESAALALKPVPRRDPQLTGGCGAGGQHQRVTGGSSLPARSPFTAPGLCDLEDLGPGAEPAAAAATTAAADAAAGGAPAVRGGVMPPAGCDDEETDDDLAARGRLVPAALWGCAADAREGEGSGICSLVLVAQLPAVEAAAPAAASNGVSEEAPPAAAAAVGATGNPLRDGLDLRRSPAGGPCPVCCACRRLGGPERSCGAVPCSSRTRSRAACSSQTTGRA
jgi:hypothetical protein